MLIQSLPFQDLNRTKAVGSFGTGSVNGNTSSSTPSASNAQTQPPQQEMVSLPTGHGSGCGHCVGMQGGLVPKAKLDALKQARFSAIMAHEQAHASAAGHLGGGIVIEYDSNGIAVSGHVPIRMPGLNPANPEQTLRDARTVRFAALSPADPSGQDKNVAAQASRIETKALALQ